MTTREQTIADLLRAREGAALELAVMPSVKEGSEWARDRYREIAWINRQLERLGAIPTTATCPPDRTSGAG